LKGRRSHFGSWMLYALTLTLEAVEVDVVSEVEELDEDDVLDELDELEVR
jgi:hypothetical protein